MVGTQAMSFSLVINHTPWRDERNRAVNEMLGSLTPYDSRVPCLINDTDFRGTDWQVSKVKWALDQWRWSVAQDVTHHIFMTDDLHIAPRLWEILSLMVARVPDRPIGLLSNHPRGPELIAKGTHWYRTNSWLVGPAYVMPHALLVAFLKHFESLTFEQQKYANDDSSINAWVTEHGPGETWHPLPTIIEHRADLESTVGHGDKFSRERVSWREMRTWVDSDALGLGWQSWACGFSLDEMCDAKWWQTEAPMLAVGE